MKYLAILLFIAPFLSSAQSIDVFVSGTSLEFSGGTYDVSSSSDQDLQVQLLIENNTGFDQNWDIERILPLSQFWDDEWLSWAAYSDIFGGSEFITDSNPIWITPYHLEVPADDSVMVGLNFKPESPGCDLYKYYLLHNDVRVDSFQIYLCKTVGLNVVTPEVVSIYPNPCNSDLNLSFQTKTPKEVVVFDFSGNEIATFEATESMIISTKEFSEGSYFLSWKMEEITFSRKFQVQH